MMSKLESVEAELESVPAESNRSPAGSGEPSAYVPHDDDPLLFLALRSSMHVASSGLAEERGKRRSEGGGGAGGRPSTSPADPADRPPSPSLPPLQRIPATDLIPLLSLLSGGFRARPSEVGGAATPALELVCAAQDPAAR
jgi:hypothetical protein